MYKTTKLMRIDKNIPDLSNFGNKKECKTKVKKQTVQTNFSHVDEDVFYRDTG